MALKVIVRAAPTPVEVQPTDVEEGVFYRLKDGHLGYCYTKATMLVFDDPKCRFLSLTGTQGSVQSRFPAVREPAGTSVTLTQLPEDNDPGTAG